MNSRSKKIKKNESCGENFNISESILTTKMKLELIEGWNVDNLNEPVIDLNSENWSNKWISKSENLDCDYVMSQNECSFESLKEESTSI